MYLLQYNLEVMNSQSGRGLHTETLDTYSHNTYWHSPYHRWIESSDLNQVDVLTLGLDIVSWRSRICTRTIALWNRAESQLWWLIEDA